MRYRRLRIWASENGSANALVLRSTEDVKTERVSGLISDSSRGMATIACVEDHDDAALVMSMLRSGLRLFALVDPHCLLLSESSSAQFYLGEDCTPQRLCGVVKLVPRTDFTRSAKLSTCECGRVKSTKSLRCQSCFATIRRAA